MELHFKYLDAVQVADKKIEGEKHVCIPACLLPALLDLHSIWVPVHPVSSHWTGQDKDTTCPHVPVSMSSWAGGGLPAVITALLTGLKSLKRADVYSRARADLGVWVVAQVPRQELLENLIKAQCCDLVPPWQSVSWHTHFLASVVTGRHWKETGRSLNPVPVFADGTWRPREGSSELRGLARTLGQWLSRSCWCDGCWERWNLQAVFPEGPDLARMLPYLLYFHLLLFCSLPSLASVAFSSVSLIRTGFHICWLMSDLYSLPYKTFFSLWSGYKMILFLLFSESFSLCLGLLYHSLFSLFLP